MRLWLHTSYYYPDRAVTKTNLDLLLSERRGKRQTRRKPGTQNYRACKMAAWLPQGVKKQKNGGKGVMKKRMLMSMLVIALVAAVIGGGTMAWFTAKADAPVNEFIAGSVMLEVGEEVVYGEDMENVNPGDCFLKCIEVENKGTKEMELRLVDIGFDVTIEWDWLEDHFYELCFTEDYEDIEDLQAAYEAGDYEIPAFFAPCPDSGWVMEYVKEEDEITGFNFYYAEGPVAPGESVNLCVVASFDGGLMGNIWQTAQFNQVNGTFQAVQASNEAPNEVWGADWNPEWLEMEPWEALVEGTSSSYADYFYDEDGFKFDECCDQANEENEENDQENDE